MAMSDEHKAALAEGRRQSRAVRSYLEALEERPSRRRRSPEKIRAKLEAVAEELGEARAVRRLTLIQERLDLESELAATQDVEAFDALQAGFVEHVAAFSERKQISWSAWVEFGVPGDVLRSGGLSPKA